MLKVIREWFSKREALHYLNFIKGADFKEVAMILAASTHMRHELDEMFGWNLLEPHVTVAADPTSPVKLRKIIQGLQKDKKLMPASGCMVWLHTLRAAHNNYDRSNNLRSTARDIWEELHRSDKYVEDAQIEWMSAFHNYINIDGYSETPAGFKIDRT